ncbi:MAG: hypothetical protein KGH69_03785 [Candidatus Micrarchaeota archaeon]|nr:hypothetical protein [Candidatus Micrarchaeota archaeon]
MDVRAVERDAILVSVAIFVIAAVAFVIGAQYITSNYGSGQQQLYRGAVITTWSTTTVTTYSSISTVTTTFTTTSRSTTVDCGAAFCWGNQTSAPTAVNCPEGCYPKLIGTCGNVNKYQCYTTTVVPLANVTASKNSSV